MVDGIIISDHNHAATDPFFNSTLNNVKTISWNSNNDGLRLQDSTTATNVFVRSGDDSLMIWGSSVTVTNATVWQNYNGGVVNLGWLNNSAGDNDLLDGLYVVKTDWLTPTANQWTAEAPGTSGSTLNGQNNGVFVSLMTPTTSFGQVSPPVYRNIFVEDQPRVLFSLKIVPPVNCPATGTACNAATLMQPSQCLAQHRKPVLAGVAGGELHRISNSPRPLPHANQRNDYGWLHVMGHDERQPDQRLDQAAIWTGAAAPELRWRLSGQNLDPWQRGERELRPRAALG